MDEIHLSRIAQWVLRQIGKALLVGTGVAVVFVVLNFAMPGSGWLPFAYLGGPLAFGIVLNSSNAPLPWTDEEQRVRNGIDNGQI